MIKKTEKLNKISIILINLTTIFLRFIIFYKTIKFRFVQQFVYYEIAIFCNFIINNKLFLSRSGLGAGMLGSKVFM